LRARRLRRCRDRNDREHECGDREHSGPWRGSTFAGAARWTQRPFGAPSFVCSSAPELLLNDAAPDRERPFVAGVRSECVGPRAARRRHAHAQRGAPAAARHIVQAPLASLYTAAWRVPAAWPPVITMSSAFGVVVSSTTNVPSYAAPIPNDSNRSPPGATCLGAFPDRRSSSAPRADPAGAKRSGDRARGRARAGYLVPWLMFTPQNVPETLYVPVPTQLIE
jgi:hypothetical protein